jgi:hypothetical protein
MVIQAQSYQRCPFALPADSRCQARRGQRGGELISADGMPRPGGDLVIASDRENVREVLGFQPGTQRPVVPVDLIADDPGERHLRSHGPLIHPPDELRLGRERHVRRYPGGSAPLRVAGPGLRQVQFPVNQRVPARGSVPEVDDDLGVFDPPGGARVLTLQPGVTVPFLTSRSHRLPAPRPGRPGAR